MNKGTYFSGQPIFGQLLNLLPKSIIRQHCKELKSDYYYKSFKTYDHLVSMLYCVFHRCTSLRETVTGMQVCHNKLLHLGLSSNPRRSTIADANLRRNSEVFERIYKSLYYLYGKDLPDSRGKKSWEKRLYIVDSTTISLFKEILKNAGRNPVNGKRKGGIKVHMMIKAEEDTPCLVRMTAAAANDAPFLRKLNLQKGSILTFDKGYVDYKQYDQFTKNGVHWVTRLRKGAQIEILREKCLAGIKDQEGVLADRDVILGHKSHKNITRIKARYILFRDSDSGKLFEFITNNFKMAAQTIAEIYKRRWQIEILFKRLKQNFPLKYFLGDNENAIRIQVWCALIADLIIKVIKRQVKKKWSFANLASMLRIHLMTYTNLFNFLENPEKTLQLKIVEKNKGPTLF